MTVLWVGLGTLEGLGPRLIGVEALWQVIALGLVVNALADYVSLLETRLLLGWLKRSRRWWVQALVLLGDLVVTGAIIWAALWAVQASGLTALLLGTEPDQLAEVVGLFSPLAVFFYSTFVTSVWTWGFILSTWLMRALARLSWLHAVFAEYPSKSLPLVLGAAALATGFAGSVASSALMAKDTQNLSFFDRALCRFAKGAVCLHIRSLTEDETTRLALTLEACRGGATEECLERGLRIVETDSVCQRRLNFPQKCRSEIPHSGGSGNQPGSGIGGSILGRSAASLWRRRRSDGGVGADMLRNKVRMTA